MARTPALKLALEPVPALTLTPVLTLAPRPTQPPFHRPFHKSSATSAPSPKHLHPYSRYIGTCRRAPEAIDADGVTRRPRCLRRWPGATVTVNPSLRNGLWVYYEQAGWYTEESAGTDYVLLLTVWVFQDVCDDEMVGI